MRRADRLFQIVQYLRGGRLVTAAMLAERLEVSERTIYRDIADLQSTGVPVDGEAGVGYVMRSGFDLPPLMFSHDEIVALVAGARIVRSWGGVAMARAAEEALVKIEAVLPDKERMRAANTQIFAPEMGMTDQTRQLIDVCEAAVDARAILSFGYRDEAGQATSRSVQPLGLWFWGKVWTLLAWCELREDFRMFRIDRMADVSPTGATYRPAPERSLAECLRQMEAQYGPQR
ncbi:helix-turn-helix transcriptional regulator [Parasphingopyxis lamellibrachiae]|uniref:HTH domain-containing protein n=1 Tax=Parasphingopyxis lamellibrachiae TaxID=680125 RepID=A0A3D9FFN7_9SPHN|nr:YafY family protein [Parasphingopyxis lamellibrachiae]RED15891.1 HTH domain-containing protein [Parasphingopyxis lamellibrachiae]